MRSLHFGRFALGGFAAAALLAGCGGSQPPIGTPRMMSQAAGIALPAFIPNFTLNYDGGPVLVTPRAYLILWDYKKYGDPNDVAKLLEEYLNVMGGSGHNNIYTQYYQDINSVTTYITNPKDQLGGVWDDETDPIPNAPTDAQVAAEALAGVRHFGYNASGSYIVATPNGHSTQGFATQWCAYHSRTYDGGELVSYTNLPYMPNAGKKRCGANAIKAPKDESGADEGVTILEGMMFGASITDPNPGQSWYNLEYGEIDICGDVKNDQFGNKSYATAAMFSNASQSCAQTY